MSNRLTTFADYIEEARQSWHVPGVAVAVIKGAEILHSGGYGVRNQESGEPVTEETIFPIASMTKAFTAMGAALAVDDGLVAWDQPIRELLPSFRLQDEYASQHATLRDLLSHRTGLPRHDAAWYGTGIDDEAVIALLRHLKPNASFREKWQYNNLMYHVVGQLSAHLAGFDNWSQLMEARIFQPLGLARTSCFSAQTTLTDDNYALPYQVRRGSQQAQLMSVFTPSFPTPAGSIQSTLADLTKWLRVHVNEGSSGDVQLVTPQNLAQMHTPHMVMPPSATNVWLFNNSLYAYGLGWSVQPYRGYTLIYHGGNIDGISVIGGFVPQKQIGIVVLTNIDGKPLCDLLFYEAVDRALDLPKREWNNKYHVVVQATELAEDREQSVSAEERQTDAPHSHPLTAYTGTFCADGYADFMVKQEEGRLRALLYGQWWPLIHYHYDVFELDVVQFELKVKVIFGVDASGAVVTVSVPVEPAVDNVVFRRAPLTVTADVLSALEGSFDVPVDGMTIVVRRKGDTLYAALTEQPETELIATSQAETSITFVMKDQPHASLSFQQIGDGYDMLRVKQFGAIFECPRIQ